MRSLEKKDGKGVEEPDDRKEPLHRETLDDHIKLDLQQKKTVTTTVDGISFYGERFLAGSVVLFPSGGLRLVNFLYLCATFRWMGRNFTALGWAKKECARVLAL